MPVEEQEEEGPLFIPQVLYEHEQPRWNDTDRGKQELGTSPVPPHTHSPHGRTGPPR
jgi:hypothetical protein